MVVRNWRIPFCPVSVRNAGFLFIVGLYILRLTTVCAQDGSGYLDINAPPIHGIVKLAADFDQPYSLNMTVGSAAVDLFQLSGAIHNVADCAGFTTMEPTLKVGWLGEGEEGTLTFFFEGEATAMTRLCSFTWLTEIIRILALGVMTIPAVAFSLW